MAPFVIAHRGDSFVRPENTLASFASALEVGCEVVEFDVQLTGDGQVVVMHDPTVDRTTSGRGRLADMTLAEVKALSAGYPSRFGEAFAGERVPTLAELLGFLRDRARALIEIKPDSVGPSDEGGIEARTLAEVRKAGMQAHVALISFSRRALTRCRQQAPEIVRGHLFHQGSPAEVMAGALEVGSDLVMPERGMLSEEMRDRARDAGLKLATWVVDDPAEMARLAPLSLYGVASNRPGALMDALRDAEASFT